MFFSYFTPELDYYCVAHADEPFSRARKTVFPRQHICQSLTGDKASGNFHECYDCSCDYNVQIDLQLFYRLRIAWQFGQPLAPKDLFKIVQVVSVWLQVHALQSMWQPGQLDLLLLKDLSAWLQLEENLPQWPGDNKLNWPLDDYRPVSCVYLADLFIRSFLNPCLRSSS